METVRVLNLLNTKASAELQEGRLEEAKETATQAVDYYLSTYSCASKGQSHHGNMMLQCQVKVSALLLRKTGAGYLEIGKQREDDDLVATGNAMIFRSSQVLKLSQHLQESRSLSARPSHTHTPSTYGRGDHAERR
jgi:phage gp36-like protein